MDDAALAGMPNGRRAGLTAALVERVTERYDVGRVLAARDVGGTYNLNARLDTSAGAYVARVYRPWVTGERLALVQEARAALVAAGVPAVAPLPARGGERSIAFGDRLVEVEPFVEHDGEADGWRRYEVAFSQLGHLHDALDRWAEGRDIPPPAVANYAEPAPLMRWVERSGAAVEAAGGADVPDLTAESARGVCEAALEVLGAIEPWWREARERLPRQPIHGDYGGGNLLFAGERIGAILDFDFLAVRERIYDLASSLFWAMRRIERERPASAWPWARIADLLAAYDAATARPLTGWERAALPIEIARVPLYWVGEAWLLDEPVGGVVAQALGVEDARRLLRHREAIARVLAARTPSGAS